MDSRSILFGTLIAAGSSLTTYYIQKLIDRRAKRKDQLQERADAGRSEIIREWRLERAAILRELLGYYAHLYHNVAKFDEQEMGWMGRLDSAEQEAMHLRKRARDAAGLLDADLIESIKAETDAILRYISKIEEYAVIRTPPKTEAANEYTLSRRHLTAEEARELVMARRELDDRKKARRSLILNMAEELMIVISDEGRWDRMPSWESKP